MNDTYEVAVDGRVAVEGVAEFCLLQLSLHVNRRVVGVDWQPRFGVGRCET